MCSLDDLNMVYVGQTVVVVKGHLVHHDLTVYRKDCCLKIQSQVDRVHPDVEYLGTVVQHPVSDLGLFA